MNLNGYEISFLGQGWRFPFGVDERGRIAVSRQDGDIEQSIRIILGTARGERVMRPEFGSSIHDFVFAPNNASTAGLLAYHVQEALVRWEPRIEVIHVDVRPELLEESNRLESTDRVRIDIHYLIKATNDERNLVFPFYLIPAEE